MFKLLIEFSFAKWFFTEASVGGDARHEFDTFKFLFIKPYIEELLARANTDPDFMTPAQRTELNTILSTDVLFNDLSDAAKEKFSRLSTIGDERLKTNIDKKISEYPISSYENLDQLINDVGHKKAGAIPVTNAKELINYLTTQRVISGESAARQSEIGGAEILRQRQEKLAKNIKDQNAKGVITSTSNPLESTMINCLRKALTIKADKVAKGLRGNLEIFMNEINSDDPISQNDIINLRSQAFAYLLLQFLTGVYEKENIAGQMQKHDNINDNDLLKIIQSGRRHVQKILESPAFATFKERLLSGEKDSAAMQALLITSVLGSFSYAIQTASKSGKPLGQVKEIFKQDRLVKNNPELEPLLNKYVEKFIDAKVKLPPTLSAKVAKESDLSPQMAAGSSDVLSQKVFDEFYPSRKVLLDIQDILSPLYKISDLLNAMQERDSKKRNEKIQAALNFGSTNNPVILNIEDILNRDDIENECEQILTALKKAGAI